MSGTLTIYRDRTNIVPLHLGYDVSADTFRSQIRVGKSKTSLLIAEFDVTFLTDGTDGELLLTLDDSVAATIVQDKGFTDVKRVSAGEPFQVYDEPIPVRFKDTVTE